MLDDRAILACREATGRPGVRVHLLRILSSARPLGRALRELSLGARRHRIPSSSGRSGGSGAASEPRPSETPAGAPPVDVHDDTHLLHVVRMALRDQLKTADLAGAGYTRPYRSRSARPGRRGHWVCPPPQAAEFLLKQIRVNPADRDTLLRQVHHVARHGDKKATAELVSLVRQGPRRSAERLALLARFSGGRRSGASRWTPRCGRRPPPFAGRCWPSKPCRSDRDRDRSGPRVPACRADS